jgi:hypothetical protein
MPRSSETATVEPSPPMLPPVTTTSGMPSPVKSPGISAVE